MGRLSVRKKAMVDDLKAGGLPAKIRISVISRGLKASLKKEFSYLLPVFQQLAETWGVARALAGRCAISVFAARAQKGCVDLLGDVTLTAKQDKLTCSVNCIEALYTAMFSCVRTIVAKMGMNTLKRYKTNRKYFVEVVDDVQVMFEGFEDTANFMAREYSDGEVIPEGYLYPDVAQSFAVRMAANSTLQAKMSNACNISEDMSSHQNAAETKRPLLLTIRMRMYSYNRQCHQNFAATHLYLLRFMIISEVKVSSCSS